MNETERIAAIYLAMDKAGFSIPETSALLRCSRTLRRWAELECGTDEGHIERDETTGKPVFYNARVRLPVPDREASALRRVAAILKSHPTLSFYHQTDPRGCALYILRPGDVPDGADPSSCYTNGIAVCI